MARARKKARAAMARSTPALPSISGKPRPVPVVASERLPVEVLLEELATDWVDWLDIVDMEDWLDMVDIEEEAWAGAAAAAGAWGAAEALPPTSTIKAPIEKSVATRQVAIFGTVRAPKVSGCASVSSTFDGIAPDPCPGSQTGFDPSGTHWECKVSPGPPVRGCGGSRGVPC